MRRITKGIVVALSCMTLVGACACSSESVNSESANSVENLTTASTAENNASSQANEEQVTPELKAFLDSYESFIDEYIVFMQKYTSNPGDIYSMMNDYSDIMLKLTDFEKKVGEYDTNEMSSADLAYYMEVTSRCSQKLLSVTY
ncbi:DUF6591 domain-containing protein [Lachnospira multipara]|uniref:DUF6591 domain-containing protein n=1 Tax=Lachnospira multipara TaxID=28051 RepID=UPI000480570F|nr:DUF6591 domain-containing protein [Lachnospira multipara]